MFIADCNCCITFTVSKLLFKRLLIIDSAILFMREHGHLSSLLHLKPVKMMSVKILTGAGTGQSREQMENVVLENKNPHQLIIA